MLIHYVQHVPFEGLGSIEGWAHSRGHEVRATRAFAGEAFPTRGNFDMLVVMGGPMNVYEEGAYPFLKDEKRLIGGAVGAGKPVLGICLGSQLIAAALGAKVYKNAEDEVGRFPVELTEGAGANALFSALPRRLMTFHWHGDRSARLKAFGLRIAAG